MPDQSQRRQERQTLYCPDCQENFLAYRSELTPRCPRCGRTVKALKYRRILRLVAAAILLTIFGIVIAVYLFMN